MMKPEPSEVALRGCASGRPPLRHAVLEEILEELLERRARRELRDVGPAVLSPACPIFTVCVVEMLTTDGSSFAARSAKLSGAGRAAAGGAARVAGASSRTAATAPATARPAESRRNGTTPDQLLAETKANGSVRTINRHAALREPARRDYERSGRASQTASLAAPASPAHQPDQDDAGAGGDEPGQPQGLRRHRQRARGGPLHPFREQGIEDALDHQDEGERRPQIPSSACHGGASSRRYRCNAGSSALTARRPSLPAARSPWRPRRPASRKSGRNCCPGSARTRSSGRSAHRDRPAASDRRRRNPCPGQRRRHRS